MTALDLLKSEELQYRFYAMGSDIRAVVDCTLKDFRVRFPDQSWDGYLVEVAEGKRDQYPLWGVRRIVKWGRADFSIFRKRWGVSVPEWMEEFYSKVTCALLPMLNQIYIMSPEEAVAAEEARRESMGESALPYRLIRFADGGDDGTGFSLRQRLDDDSWEIVPTGPQYTAMEYQSAIWEQPGLSDRDVNAWLLRMLNTDGHPLMIGNEEFEPMPYRRVPAELVSKYTG
ncbi:hypothetical protein [Verrucomicrobium spinosum]|uniref:hypothetical protein n=2 Tax=Verrucomicrobium spinosum TaxID=2736 RepID=UPI000492B4FA|nr:hypothetical protein [Verrucomicrobium spinosum]